MILSFFFFNDTATTEIYTLSLHDALPISLACAGLANAQVNARSDNGGKNSPTPPGLYITPTALPNAVQQELSPGLKNYPNFVAGEAVKAVVSPDGKNLAILTAGMHSLYVPNSNPDPSHPFAT